MRVFSESSSSTFTAGGCGKGEKFEKTSGGNFGISIGAAAALLRHREGILLQPGDRLSVAIRHNHIHQHGPAVDLQRGRGGVRVRRSSLRQQRRGKAHQGNAAS
jgi:hypothetical protein